MSGIPKEFEEAAEIDGCGKFYFSQDYPYPVSNRSYPASGGAAVPGTVFQQHSGHYGGSLSSLPVLLLYGFGQDELVKGRMAGAFKG
ncbi:MAG: hypothetical protein LBD58_13650 [Treponema sp.]|jgi:ABC-type glycerol-3-phosphate transport system permease component|nr:hypothetical protein [Treponema sp.]